MTQLEQKIFKCNLCDSLGINFKDQRKENYLSAYQYKPEKVNILWVVESPPKSDPPRYFYRRELTAFDSLFRETMKALEIPVMNPKHSSLIEFQRDGHFLIDSIKCPADKSNSYLKPQLRNNCRSILREEIISLNPVNILVIKADNYSPILNLLRDIDNDLPYLHLSEKILNKQPIPFPGSGQQKRFRELVRFYLGIKT